MCFVELYAVADLRISAHNNKAIIEWHNGLCSGAYIQYYVVQYSVVGEGRHLDFTIDYPEVVDNIPETYVERNII